MYIAEFESICGKGKNIKEAIDDFQLAYGDYNGGNDAPIADITLYNVIKTGMIEVEYKMV